MAGDNKQADFRTILRQELKTVEIRFFAKNQNEIQSAIKSSETKILKLIKKENRKIMTAIANIALNSPTLSMFRELEEKFDRYFSKN